MARSIPAIPIPAEDDEVILDKVSTPGSDDRPAEFHTGYEYDYATNDYRIFD